MREEKIISSSIALEKCRSTIIKEIEKKLALSTNPWQMDLLEKKLETLLIKKNFEQYKTLIKAKMGDHDLKDYKIELFIRLFIVKPILDDNVQRLLESIKEKIKTEFILKFPIETMTLSNFQKESPVLGVDGSPQSFIEKPLESLRNHLSLGSNFDNLVAMIISQVRYLESILSSQADYKVNAEKLAADNSKAMKAIERNCTAILEISVQIFTALCKNYQLAKYMSEENLNGLLVDFEKYVKKLLVRDKRKIGQLSPIIVTEAINLEIKRAWREVKRKFIQDMKFSKKKLEKDDSCKMRVMMQCKQSMEERFKDTFGFIPHSGIFFDECLSKVGENIDNLIKIRNSEHLLMLKPVHESLKLDFNSILSLMLKPETKYRFKYFPVLEDLSPDRILTVNLRKWLVFSFIVFSAQFSDDPHHSQIMSTVQTLATTLDVSNDQDIKEAFEKLTEFETRSQRIEFLQEGQILSQEKLKETMGHLDANQLTYLILGLVTATTDCERDLLELRRAVSQNDIASLRSPNYRKRRLLLQVLGLLNGKDLDWTCQFSLHMIEMLIEKLRLTHNRYVTTKIIKKDLGQIYTTDYNAAFEKFRHKPSEDLISLLNNTMYHENHHPDCKKKEEFEFKKNFVLDMSFRHNKIEGKIVSQNLWQVDEELTLEKITEDLLLKRVFKKLSPKNSGLNCEAESSETIDQKFIAKIQYLRETIKKIKFSSLQSDTSIRSRCSILCISSFEDDESSLWNGWSELSQRFPFTEVTGITCESYTNNHAFGALWNTMKDVSFKSHSNMLVNSASKSLQEQNIDQKQSCSKSDVQLNRKSTKEISTSGFSNPFVEASDEEFQKEFELEDTNERDFVGKNDKINIWKLWKDKKPKEILTRETILKVGIIYSRPFRTCQRPKKTQRSLYKQSV